MGKHQGSFMVVLLSSIEAGRRLILIFVLCIKNQHTQSSIRFAEVSWSYCSPTYPWRLVYTPNRLDRLLEAEADLLAVYLGFSRQWGR